MSTKNKDLTISLSPEILALLSSLAKKKNVPIAALTKQILESSLEDQEDRVLSAIAEERDKEPLETIPDEKVW